MGLTKKALSITAVAGLAATALTFAAPTHVLAGTGPSQTCEDNAGHDDIPVITSPITLGVEIGSPALAGEGHQGADGTSYVSVCYSPTPYGTGGGATGGAISAHLANAGTATAGTVSTGGTACYPDSPETVSVNCAASASPSYSYTPAAAPQQGGVVTVTIPFTVCFGTNLTGGCSPSLSGPITAGGTGVIVTTTSTAAPGGTDVGAAAAAPSAIVYLAGIPFAVDQGPSAGAGVGTRSVEAHPNNATPLCILNGYCPSVPVGAAAAFTGTQDVFAITLNGTSYSYNPGYYCIVDSPGAATC